MRMIDHSFVAPIYRDQWPPSQVNKWEAIRDDGDDYEEKEEKEEDYC